MMAHRQTSARTAGGAGDGLRLASRVFLVLLLITASPITATAADDALQTVKKQAQDGDREAQFQLAQRYLQGKGINSDPQQAAQWMLRAAKQGHARAQFFMGVMYRSGLGVPADRDQALHWFRLAATWGDKDAQNAYRDMRKREAVRQASTLAARADSGDAAAAYQLGKMYLSGEGGVARDVTQALQWLQQAAEAGHVASQNELGLLYHKGAENLPADQEQARKWLQLAVANGSQEGRVLLKDISREQQAAALSTRERMRQLVQRVPYLDQAQQGDAEAQYRLGMMYLRGEGLDRNPQAGLHWLRQAAEQDFRQAQLDLGQFLVRGVEVDQDYNEAVRWFSRAAQSGDAEAQYMLANLYRSGLGVEQNAELARKWYEEAARQGHARAKSRLGGG